MDARLKSILSEFRLGLEAIYGDRLVDLVLYGSRVRADAQPDSDIDLLVVLWGKVQPYEEIGQSSALECPRVGGSISCDREPVSAQRSEGWHSGMTDDQAALLEKARRNVRAAKILASEGEFDIAITRAYYAMFY